MNGPSSFPPKTRSSRRTIPISASLAEVFKRLRPQNCEPEQLVFATPKGTPLNPKNLYNRQLAPACDAIEQPRVSWHSFRHTHDLAQLMQTGDYAHNPPENCETRNPSNWRYDLFPCGRRASSGGNPRSHMMGYLSHSLNPIPRY